MPKCLVLGANGFIGSHLVDALAAAGHEVRAFGRFKTDTTFDENDLVEIFPGNFLNTHDLAEAVSGIEYVFHFISTTTPATAENDPLIDVETNVKMSIKLFEACSNAGVKRVLFASTGGSIYGEGSDKAFTEDSLPKPVSPYAIGKLSIEHYLRYFRVKHGLDSVVFRISNPYGERQPINRKQGVIPIFLESLSRGNPLTVLGDGDMVRDYVYVGDVANMLVAMFDAPTKHSVYNIGSGVGYSVNELVTAVEGVCQKQAEIVHVPAPATFIHKVVLDTSRFREEFDIAPLTPLDQGLEATLKFIESEIQNGSQH